MKNRNSGFTLLDLLIFIVLIRIGAAIIAPSVIQQTSQPAIAPYVEPDKPASSWLRDTETVTTPTVPGDIVDNQDGTWTENDPVPAEDAPEAGSWLED